MNWLLRVFRRSRLEEQLETELKFHREQYIAELKRRGLTETEARRRAMLELGGAEQAKEVCRDARGTRWIEDFLQDFRFALRTLRQRPGFAAVALVTLALGIGATTVMFTIVDGVLFKPFAYRDPGHLLRLQERTDWSNQFGNIWAFSYPNYLDCKAEARTVDMAAYQIVRGTVAKPGAPEFVDGAEMSHDLFPLLGVDVAVGRQIRGDEDQPGGPPVAVISHALWERQFGASPSALGSQITFDGKVYTVIGVMAAGFRLDDIELDIFTPISQDASPRMRNRRAHGFGVWGRLRPGATLEQAQSELNVIGRRLAPQYPDTNKGRTFVAELLKPDVEDTRSTLWLLLGAVTLVLLIACANIASLLLARAVSRERELAMRAALGAGRGRLARQCFTESAVLGIGGGILGVIAAAFGVRPFVAFWPGVLPRAHAVQLDWHVLLFALAVSLASGFLFGLAPALRPPGASLERALRSGSRTLTASSRRLHGAFIISEIALAVVLLVCSGILGRTLLRLAALDPGVDVHNVLISRTALSPATLANPDRTRAAWRELMDRARTVPGVEAIAMVDTVPMREGSNPTGYKLSAADVPDDKQPIVLANSVSPDYLKVTGIPLRRGRFLTDQDRKGSESVAVIDEVMAQQAFPGRDPIGQHLWIGIGPDPVTVVGVVGHVRQWGLAADDQSKIRAQLYYPFAQVPDNLVRRWSELMSIAVRTRVNPLTLVEPLRREVRGVTGDQVLYEVDTFEELASKSIALQKFLLLLFSIFAGLALLLASIGIYGVLAHLTGQRVPEIGVRMALGASGSEVICMVLRQSLVMMAVGAAIGVTASIAAARVLERFVEGIRSGEPSTFVAVLPVLAGTTLLAAWLPAYRASRVDPVIALRHD